jgi:hypothetical protein
MPAAALSMPAAAPASRSTTLPISASKPRTRVSRRCARAAFAVDLVATVDGRQLDGEIAGGEAAHRRGHCLNRDGDHPAEHHRRAERHHDREQCRNADLQRRDAQRLGGVRLQRVARRGGGGGQRCDELACRGEFLFRVGHEHGRGEGVDLDLPGGLLRSGFIGNGRGRCLLERLRVETRACRIEGLETAVAALRRFERLELRDMDDGVLDALGLEADRAIERGVTRGQVEMRRADLLDEAGRGVLLRRRGRDRAIGEAEQDRHRDDRDRAEQRGDQRLAADRRIPELEH